MKLTDEEVAYRVNAVRLLHAVIDEDWERVTKLLSGLSDDEASRLIDHLFKAANQVGNRLMSQACTPQPNTASPSCSG